MLANTLTKLGTWLNIVANTNMLANTLTELGVQKVRAEAAGQWLPES